MVHLHGVWDEPSSVIFGQEDYAGLTRDPVYLSFVQTLWTAKTILFIGCSFDGMLDPDFGRLLEWTSTTFPHATVRHFAMVRATDYTPDKVDEFLNRYRVQLVPYGSAHSDLGPFLRSLAGPPRPDTPRPPRTFAGREAEIAQVETALAEGKSCLVHGMGGIGKTSLVAKVIETTLARNPSTNVVWVEGTGSTLPQLCRDVATGLSIPGVTAAPDSDVSSVLRAALGLAERVLIVLDDIAEQQVARAFVTEVLPPSVPVLVSSRRRIIGFDESIEVGPLPVSSSCQVFAAVAGVAGDSPIVRDLAVLLEGHPLALGLAAGRHAAEAVPLQRLYERLSTEKGRLDTLRDPDGDDVPSTSVRASIAVSLEGLDPLLAETLYTLAHFYSDTTVDLLAEAMTRDVSSTEDRVGLLVSRSLIQRSGSGQLHLHRLIVDAVRGRAEPERAQYELKADRAIQTLISAFTPDDDVLRRRLIGDMDNVLAYANTTAGSSSAERKARVIGLAVALNGQHGLLDSYDAPEATRRSAANLVTIALDLFTGYPDTAVYVTLLQCQAHIHLHERNTASALTSLADGLALVREHGLGKDLEATLLCDIGNVHLAANDHVTAEERMRSGLAEALASGSQVAEAQLRGQLGRVLLKAGRLDESWGHYLEARQLYEAESFDLGVAATSANLAEIALKKGDLEGAWRLHRESLEAEMRAGNFHGALGSLESLAHLVRSQEQFDYVEAQVQDLIRSAPPYVIHVHGTVTDSIMADAMVGIRRLEAARTCLAAVLSERQAREDLRGVAVTAGKLSVVCSLQQDFRSATEYNLTSLHNYSRTSDIEGAIKCHFNQIDFSFELRDANAAARHAFEAMRLSAESRSVELLVQTFAVFGTRIVPRLQLRFSPIDPPVAVTFSRLMDLIAEAAASRDLDRLVGRVKALTERFDAGGRPSS